MSDDADELHIDLITVDPGVRGCGIALWSRKKLVMARYVRGDRDADFPESVTAMTEAVSRALTGLKCTKALVEMPQIYHARAQQKGDQNDLLALAAIVGALCLMFAVAGSPAEVVRPATWKGQVPKAVMVERVRGKLFPLEIEAIEETTTSLAHNVMDAIGIGLHRFGRL